MSHRHAHKAIKTNIKSSVAGEAKPQDGPVQHQVHDGQGEVVARVEGGAQPDATYSFTRPVTVGDVNAAVQAVKTAVAEEHAKVPDPVPAK